MTKQQEITSAITGVIHFIDAEKTPASQIARDHISTIAAYIRAIWDTVEFGDDE